MVCGPPSPSPHLSGLSHIAHGHEGVAADQRQSILLTSDTIIIRRVGSMGDHRWKVSIGLTKLGIHDIGYS